MSRCLSMVVVMLLLPGLARGDEAMPGAPVRPAVHPAIMTQEGPPPPGLKSEGKALTLAITGVVLPSILLVHAASEGNESMAWVGVGAMVVLPSAGHWYVGEVDALGLGLRGLSAASLVGLVLLADELHDDAPTPEKEEDEGHGWPSLGDLAIAGGFLTAAGFLGFGGLYSPMTVRGAVQRHNDALYLAPFAGKASAGLSLVGTF